MTEIEVEICKPLLKWVGGKSQIIDKITKKVPVTMENYYELFLGGGSVLSLFCLYKSIKKLKLTKKYTHMILISILSIFIIMSKIIKMNSFNM